MRKFLTLAAVLMFLAGLAVLLYPAWENQRQEQGYEQKLEAFHQGQREEIRAAYPELLASMQEYNQKIYTEGQVELKDAFSYEDPVFDLAETGMEDAVIGSLTIDAMDIQVPLYLGASKAHLREGAAVLGQTSMPIGGENTNCVIAGHRGGYHGEAMFRDIELLKPGDKVIVENLWEKLEYQVVKTIVIKPDDIEAVKIIPGEELLTLVTCHPYGNNYQRYVVYCTRLDGKNKGAEDAFGDRLPEGIAFTPSQPDIEKEKTAGKAVLAAGVILVVLLTAVLIIKKRS